MDKLPIGSHAAIICHMTKALGSNGIVPTIEIRHRIGIAREVAGMKQVDLARELGMSRSTLAGIEQGTRKPRRGEVIAIAFATGVSLDWLETGETPAGDNPDGGSAVRHQGIEPRTHWLRSFSRVSRGDDVGINRRALETAA